MNFSLCYLKVLTFLLWILKSQAKLNINMTEYFIMPKLNIFQDYDKCLLEHPNTEALYCMVDSTIKPDNSSHIWSLIESYSMYRKRRFRHDRLQRGICLATCMELMHNVDSDNQDELYQEAFDDKGAVRYDVNVFQNAKHHGSLYNKLINQCVNYELRQYKLRAHSTIEYCISNQPNSDYYDWLDVCFVLVYMIINLAVIISTVIDLRLKKTAESKKNNEHYKKPLSSRKDQILVAFSLPRNWFLMSKSNQRPPLDAFEFMNSIKFLTMYLIICGHTLFFSAVYPIDNTYYLESRLQDVSIAFWINGATVTQTFFVISGFFQAFKFIQDSKKQDMFTFNFFWKTILHRYLRLTPVYAFTLLFDSSVMLKMQNGPFWPRVQELEQYACRKNWWSHLLYLNNYISNTNEMCLTHSWFLAVDFQMYVFCVILLMLTSKFPAVIRNCLIFLVAALSFCIPALVTYINDYDSLFILEPEAVKYGLNYMETFKKLYIPTHTNMGCYMVGIIGGFTLDLIFRRKINVNQFKSFKIMWYSLIAIGCVVVIAGYFVYENSMESTTWKYVFALMDKNVWGILAAFFGWGLISKVGGPIRRLINVPLFRFLGKTSYCAYLWHVLVLRLVTGYYRQPFYSGNGSYTLMANTAIILTFLLSIVLSLFIEYPFMNLQRIFFKAIEKRKETPKHEAGTFNENVTKL